MNDSSGAIRRIVLDGRNILLIGTAHISQASVETVRSVIATENPDQVCVELDEPRCQALRDDSRWRSLNLIEVIRKGQGPFLLASLALTSFQKRMGLQTGVKPGAELLAAVVSAEEAGIAVSLVDRPIRTTLLRAWRKTGFWKRINLLATLLAGLFETQKIDEAELEKLRQTDTLSAMLEEMGTLLPSVKTILVDERDTFMADRIRNAPGQKVVAVVGAAHLPGIERQLQTATDPAVIAEISSVPAETRWSKLLPWLIPGIVIALFVAGFFVGDWSKLADAAIAWVLLTGGLCALGTALAFGHPLTILAGFVAAPITTLHPALGAGMFTGIVQAFVAAPTVADLERVGEDVASIGGWWRNRTIRVLLVFFFSSLGASVGMLVALRWVAGLI
jgi:pheromone shutdown-related protein TraB